ncbi:MAG: ribonuclease P protein component [Candidatus Wildermuthbacteria bacterium RIFCSPHIGHO2_12_FULL_45_9]|uniref:Ribonuclease P protein component n=1 Tax=Candidatus Wildermuthbacteria bacterium RIFCSPHIGHO2_02_FULL_45_25 TaxID=1802450 RepID=A0A1G2R1D0_9BACT|nr:MAG: ribonuclease P protein component [Candidatus Wildermuthbacteria bacterium RIFCSPHIGHO2_02_FULL_45_25]OHA70850.1 MAG: ribonuclease P protein component [Candidatus Wildermuthbacteria bacterium RIFCSPHIGHO2_12_FULL_45_9]
MLSKLNRLSKKKDFDRIFRQGKGIRHEGLLAKIWYQDIQCSRFGIVVSKKIAKKAVVRNRIRRLISQALQKRLKRMAKHADIILVVLPGSDFSELRHAEEAVEQIFKKAGLFA